MSMNWPEDVPSQMPGATTGQMGGGQMTEHMRPRMAMPVFAGQKLVVAGDSSGLGAPDGRRRRGAI